jgi:outer membrane lipoprotein-sorting protein
MTRIVLFLAFSFTSILSFSQTAEEVVATYIKNIGGADKLKNISSVQMKAAVDYGGMSIPIEMISLRDGRSVMKITFQGQEMVQMAYDGKTAWGTSFMTMKPEKNDAEQTENIKRSLGDFISPLIDYKANGYSIELLPNETIEGVECFKLKLTKKPMLVDGKEVPNIEFYYIDKENFVPIVVEAEIPSGEMKGNISQTVYSDYQEVDGVYFPFSMTQRLKDGEGQTIEFEKVVLNGKFEDKIFIFPVDK